MGTVAAGALGVAAVGGLGYLAYKHFKGGPNQPPGYPQMHPGMQQGHPGMQQGQPGMQGSPGGFGAGGAPGMYGHQAGGGGFMGSVMGASNSLRTDGFSAPGYEHQMGGAAPQQPVYPPFTRDQPQPPHAPAPPTNYQNLPPTPPPYQGDGAAPPAPTADQQGQALLLVRAMIAAAYADGTLDEKERTDILSRIDSAGVGPEERAAFLKELESPKPVTMLAAEVTTPELAEQFYIVSALSISADSEAEKAHLRMLPALLKLAPEHVAALHQKAGLPPV